MSNPQAPSVDLTKYYKPHPGQLEVHKGRRAGAEVIVLQVGRRWGKTRLGFGDLMDTYNEVLQMHRGPELIPPFQAWVVLPAYPQAKQVWRELQSLIPSEALKESRYADRELWLMGNDNWQGRHGVIEMKSGVDADTLQTVGNDYLWFSESHDISNEAQEKAWGTLVSPDRLGRVLAEGIPSMYADHWFQRMYNYAERNPGRFFAYRATSFENPMLTERHLERIEEARDLMSAAAWERNFLAKFSSGSGFFRNVDACIAGDIWKEPIPGITYTAGLDMGRVNDPTVLYILDANGRRVVARFSWGSEHSWVYIRDHIVALHEQWVFRALVFDASSLGGVALGEDMARTSLPLVPLAIVGVRRQELLERLAGAIERETLHYPPIKSLLRQLYSMQSRRMPGGMYRIEVPRGEHDDEIFALALALTECNDPQPVQAFKSLGRNSYLPTQKEVDSGTSRFTGRGPKIMRERREARMRERAERAGIAI